MHVSKKRQQKAPEPSVEQGSAEPPNPGDPGPQLPEQRVPVDPAEDPRIPHTGDLPPRGA